MSLPEDSLVEFTLPCVDCTRASCANNPKQRDPSAKRRAMLKRAVHRAALMLIEEIYPPQETSKKEAAA